VFRLQQRKRWLSETILGDVGAGATGPLTEGEVESLFAPNEESAGED
jgi:hypothetical protein